MKELIIYYSRRGENYTVNGMKDLKIGNTEVVANMIREIRGADLFRVETKEEYPSDYDTCTKVAKEELENGVRPELKEYLSNMDEYETIYIGFPNWWGTMPMPLVNQLERLNFEGKKVMLFCTHEGSGMGNSINDLKKYCVGANILEGLPIQGSYVNDSKNLIIDWLK